MEALLFWVLVPKVIFPNSAQDRHASLCTFNTNMLLKYNFYLVFTPIVCFFVYTFLFRSLLCPLFVDILWYWFQLSVDRLGLREPPNVTFTLGQGQNDPVYFKPCHSNCQPFHHWLITLKSSFPAIQFNVDDVSCLISWICLEKEKYTSRPADGPKWEPGSMSRIVQIQLIRQHGSSKYLPAQCLALHIWQNRASSVIVS